MLICVKFLIQLQSSNLPSPIIDFGIFPDDQRLFDQLDDPIVFVDFTNGRYGKILIPGSGIMIMVILDLIQ